MSAAYTKLGSGIIDGAPTIVRLPKKVRPEDITINDLNHLSNDSFALWTQTSGVRVDNNPIEFNTHRYLLPIYMCNDTEIVWRKAAQLGATVYMLLRMIWWLHVNQGRKAGLYFPTKEGVENLSKDRLTPLLQSVPSLRASVDNNDKLGLRRIGKSSFYLFHLGGVASKDSVPLDFVAFDEVRLCKASDIDQALERISHSPYKEKIFMSTAGQPGADIDARFELGTQHVWRAKCFCFSYDTEIWVRNKHTGDVSVKSFKDLSGVWKDYQALSKGPYKRLQFKDITAFHHNGIKNTVKVKFRNGTSVVCTPDHVFFRQDKTLSRIIETKLSDIPLDNRYKNKLICAKTIPSDGVRQVPYDNDTLFVIGAYIAEGSWYTDTDITITQKNDTKIREVVLRWAANNNLHCLITPTALRISLASRPDLIELFKQCGRGAQNKQVPEDILLGTTDQLKYLLQGYLTGNGHDESLRTHDNRGYTTNTSWSCVTTSELLAKQLQLIGLRLGTPLYVSHSKPKGKLPIWSLEHNPKSAFASNLVGGDLAQVSIQSIEDHGTIPVADITVADNHNYVLANGVVAHNCSDGVDLARTFPDCVVDDKRRGKLYLRCPKCKAVINDPQNGRYVPMNPGADYTSFHVSQLVSKYISLKEIWNFYHRTTNITEFYNAKLGLPFIDEENRGVSMDQLKECVDPQLEWAKPGSATHTAMGVDVGGGYCYVVIADLADNKKRIRHLEIIESDNPHYRVNGKRVSPFRRLRELMREYKVQLCVVDAMPNYDMVLEFAQDFPGKVFAAFYAKESKDVVSWSDRPKTKVSLKKAGPLLKFKHYCVLSRFLSMDFALGEWARNNVICPDPKRLVQMCFDEKTKQLQPEAITERFFSMLSRLVKNQHILNEETGESRFQYIYSGGDPHFAHAWNYANIALERMRRQVVWTFG